MAETIIAWTDFSSTGADCGRLRESLESLRLRLSDRQTMNRILET